MAIGFALTVPVIFLTGPFASNAVSALFTSIVMGLVVCAVLALIVYVFRRAILRALLGDVQVCAPAIPEALGELAENWTDADARRESASRAARETLAVGGWLFAKASIVTVLLGMVGTTVAAVGAVLLLKQTQSLEAQNKKLDAQEVLLARQNDIMAGEGRWEELWNAYDEDNPPNRRLEAATALANKGESVRGVSIWGGEVKVRSSDPFGGVWGLPGQLEGGKELPFALSREIDQSMLTGFKMNWRLRESITNCTIRYCVLFPPVRVRRTFFEQCQIVNWKSSREFEDCFFDTVTFGVRPNSSGELRFNNCLMNRVGFRTPPSCSTTAYVVENCAVGSAAIHKSSKAVFQNCCVGSLAIFASTLEEIKEVLSATFPNKDCQIDGLAVHNPRENQEPEVNVEQTDWTIKWIKENLRKP